MEVKPERLCEDAPRVSEQNLKLIIDTIPALAWSARPDGTADFFNQHYLDFMGIPAEQASGWGWTAAVHPDDLNSLSATWRGIMASGAQGEAEARLRRHDGEYRWFLFRVNPLRDERGGIVKWYGTNTDIDDRKRAEAQRDRTIEELRARQSMLSEREQLFRAIFDEAGTGIALADLQQPGTPIQNNRALRTMLGISQEGLGLLETYDELTVEDDREADAAAYRELCEGRRDSLRQEKHFTLRDGSSVWANVIFTLLRDSAGRPRFVIAIHEDITERRLSEEALGSLRSELAHVSRVATLGALTASIAHEVNQPLSGIVTNASTCLRMLAADPPNVEGARETARRTIRDGHRASDVITRLRALFGKKGATAEPVDLNEATREVLALSLSELRRSRVIPRLELAEDLPPVAGDRVQLRQVILNLLLNALDAMSGVEDYPTPLVIRTARDEGDRVRLSVRDAGVGFDPRAAGRLFEAFYTTKNDGMGIGLSVSRSIIESHQGRLWATLNDGRGATFSFSIPHATGAAAAASGVGEIPATASTDAERLGGDS